MIHTCKYCNYSTTQIAHYYRHQESERHNLNVLQFKRDEELKKKEEEIRLKEEEIKQMELERQRREEQLIQKEEQHIQQLSMVADKIDNLDNDLTKRDKQLKKEIKTEIKNNNIIVTTQINEVKKIANKNIKYSKSILARLNEEYKDSPPLEYPGDKESLTAIKDFYGISLDQALKTNKLQKALLKDFKNKTLVDTIIKILLGFLHKDNIHSQSVFNTDTARYNYAAKHDSKWKPDKAGEYLNTTVIKPFCTIIKTLMMQFVKYKYAQSDYRKKKLYNKDRSEDDIFLDKDEDEFVDLDDSSDECRHFIDQLDEICLARELIKYVDRNQLYDEIIAKLSPKLNYNVRVKNN